NVGNLMIAQPRRAAVREIAEAVGPDLAHPRIPCTRAVGNKRDELPVAGNRDLLLGPVPIRQPRERGSGKRIGWRPIGPPQPPSEYDACDHRSRCHPPPRDSSRRGWAGIHPIACDRRAPSRGLSELDTRVRDVTESLLRVLREAPLEQTKRV